MPPESPSQFLRVCLIKPEYTQPEMILRAGEHGEVPPSGVQQFALKSGLPFTGHFYLRQRDSSKKPKWLSFVREGVDGDIRLDDNSSISAVLLVSVGDRWFAITYGYGRSLLREEALVRDFGFRIALNRVDPDDLRSLDSHTFEERSIHTRRQTSRGSSLGAFGIDVTQDLLRAVTGKARDESFAGMLTGSDALAASVNIGFLDLGTKCESFLEAYESEEYREQGRFEFVDRIAQERDVATVQALNDSLLSALGSGDFTRLHMCPPEPFDWGQDFGGFCFSTARNAEAHWDVEPQTFVASLRTGEVTVDLLKRRRVCVRTGSSDYPHEQWSVYRCIVFETEHNGEYYVLSDGEWYRILPDFVTRVNSQATELLAETPILPPARGSESEPDYNSRVPLEEPGYIALDRKCATIDGDQIEVCDLLSRERELIHIKRWNSSSTLSHLFRQGVNSAICLLADDPFRANARQRVAEKDPGAIDLIPSGMPSPDQFTVVFGVIYPSARSFPEALPFFSKLNLVNAAQELRQRRFGVSLIRVQTADQER